MRKSIPTLIWELDQPRPNRRHEWAITKHMESCFSSSWTARTISYKANMSTTLFNIG
ncbi:phosphoenolpyruvate synthase [Sesbania bispinosa]|nr:phosphoenolpyruvate synthase [Sesbania bispinosa]